MRVPRAGRMVPLLFGSILASSAAADFTGGFPSPESAAEVNERTVGIVLERDERLFDLLEDIESSLSLAAGLRIVPIVGRNHVQNVYDLLYLDGVDLALVRADSIEYVRRAARLAGTRRLTHSVARVGREKIVVVANEAYASLEALAGRPVGFGRAESGEFVTGSLLFDTLGLDVEKVEAAGDEALARVSAGELAAVVHLLGPDEVLAPDDVGPDGALRALELPRDARLSTLYRPTTLAPSELPGLIGEDGAVPTYSVDVNLVAYSWSSPNERTRRMDRFVDALVERLDELQGDALEPEWETVSLEPATPNVDDSPMVERALAERAAALERWHETRVSAREAEADGGTVYVEQRLPGGGTVIRRLDEGAGAPDAGAFAWLIEELDALSANRSDGATAGRVPFAIGWSPVGSDG